MMILILTGIFAALCAISIWMDYSGRFNNDYVGAFIIWGILSVFSFVVWGTMIICTTNCNIKDTESIANDKRKLIIYVEKQKVLQHQYETLLDSTYGAYEKNMYNSMTEKNGSNSNVSVNVYPGPKYSETIIELTKKISELNESIYAIRFDLSNLIQSINTRYKNPLNVRMFLPPLSESLKEIPANL